MIGTDKPHSPKEVTVRLDIADSTLRKWCLALEVEGYYFSRTDNNRRVFFERDLVVLRNFQKLVQVQNLSLENAAKVVATKFSSTPSEQKNDDNSVPSMRSDDGIMNKIMDEIEQLKELNYQLVKRIEERDKYIEERIDKRDSMLMESLREIQQTKKLMIEQDRQREEEKKQTKKKGLFGWFTKSDA